MNSMHCLLSAIVVIFAVSELDAREWSDTTGRYKLEAELFAQNDEYVILQRQDKELAMFPVEKLSEQDRQYLESKPGQDVSHRNLGQVQTWTMRNGLKVVGRIVDYGRKEMTVQRRRGKVYVNDRLYNNLPPVYQKIVPKIVAHFEDLEDLDERGFQNWVRRQRGKPRTFQLEGVILEHEQGDEYGVPFFFFAEQDLALLKSGWEEWLAAHDDYEERDDESFRVQALAAAKHSMEVQRGIATAQLNMLAVSAGLTAAWEVTLYPARGNPRPPIWVVVPGRTSAEATATAVRQHPGYVAGPVRRVSR